MRKKATMRTRQVEADGLAFHVIEQGSGPAVVFCHGFTDTAETWRSQMGAVARAGYRALALDMRGYGNSYAPVEPSLYSAPHIVGDLVSVIDALKIDTAILVGHDWGADVVQRAAVMRPDRFRAVVTLSIPPSTRGDISFYGELARQGMEDRFYAFGMMNPGAEMDFEPAAKTIPRILYWLSGSPPPDTGWDPGDPARHMLRPAPATLPTWAEADYVRRTVRAFEKSGFRGGLNYYRAAKATFDLMAAFKNVPIRQPSLYIWGAEDGLCRLFHAEPPTVEDFRAAAPGLVDVIRLEGVGHWIQHEASERLNAELVWSAAGREDACRAHATRHGGPLWLRQAGAAHLRSGAGMTLAHPPIENLRLSWRLGLPAAPGMSWQSPLARSTSLLRNAEPAFRHPNFNGFVQADRPAGHAPAAGMR